MAEELQVVSNQVPAQIEELVNFVKVGREKLSAVRAEIRAIDKLGLEDEKRQKVLEQARTLSEQLLDAEVRLGEIMASLPEAPGKRTDLTPEDSNVQMSKKEILQQAGFSVKTAQRYETLASHLDVVERMKAEAREKGAVVSRTAILRAISSAKESYDKEHLSLSTNERRTVSEILLGFTDLTKSYDVPLEDQTWEGKFLLIPPRSSIDAYIAKLEESFDAISAAIIVVPDDFHEDWYEQLMLMSNAVVHRYGVDVKTDMGNEMYTHDKYAFFYIGNKSGTFLEYNRNYGWGHSLNKMVSGHYKRLKK